MLLSFSIFVLFSLAKCICHQFTENEYKHILTAVFHRHGARNPGKLFKEEIFGGRKNELTEVGKQQMLDLGLYFNKNLVKTGFLSDLLNENQEEAIFYTSPKDRTILSLISFLEGLYGTQDIPNWTLKEINSIMNNDKVECETKKKCLLFMEKENDIIFHGAKPDVCPLNSELKAQNKRYPEYQYYLKKFQKKLFRKMANKFNQQYNTTFNSTNVMFDQFSIMNDALYCGEYNMYSPLEELPYFKREMIKKIRKAKFIQQFIGRYAHPKLHDQASNAFFTILKTAIIKKVKKENENLKYLHFSGHDTGMVGIIHNLADFQIFKKRHDNFIPFASYLQFNLLQKNDEYFLEVIFNNLPLIIKDSKTNIISLERAINLLDDGINPNYGVECKKEMLFQ